MSKLELTLVLSLFICICANKVESARRPPKELASGQNCTDHKQIIDKCSTLATYSYITSTNPYPLTTNELKTSCDRIGDGVKCLRQYSKCLTSLARRSITAYATARSRHSKRICANLADQKATEFIKSSECIVKTKNKKDLMIASEKELISTIQMLATNVTMKWEIRFHQACCAADRYRTKVLRDAEPECAKYRTTNEEMVRSMVGELLEVVCPEENRLNDICLKLPKLTVKEWGSGSLSSAALDLIISLSDSDPKDN